MEVKTYSKGLESGEYKQCGANKGTLTLQRGGYTVQRRYRCLRLGVCERRGHSAESILGFACSVSSKVSYAFATIFRDRLGIVLVGIWHLF